MDLSILQQRVVGYFCGDGIHKGCLMNYHHHHHHHHHPVSLQSHDSLGLSALFGEMPPT
jgi:hypothetical protein